MPNTFLHMTNVFVASHLPHESAKTLPFGKVVAVMKDLWGRPAHGTWAPGLPALQNWSPVQPPASSTTAGPDRRYLSALTGACLSWNTASRVWPASPARSEIRWA